MQGFSTSLFWFIRKLIKGDTYLGPKFFLSDKNQNGRTCCGSLRRKLCILQGNFMSKYRELVAVDLKLSKLDK